jgi:Lsr2
MMQKIQTLLIDDLDGGDAEGTVRFGLDGADYEIDLSAGHAEALRKALEPYVSDFQRIENEVERAFARAVPPRACRSACDAVSSTALRSAHA